MKYGYDRNERELELIVKECAELTHASHDRPNDIGLDRVTKKWAELFLENWNRAVKLWNHGKLFGAYNYHSGIDQAKDQREYARICCSWIIIHGMVEPHLVAEGG